MTSLITLDEAKMQLRVIGDQEDAAIAAYAMAATAIIIDYIKRPGHGWTAETVPILVKSAILLALLELDRREDGNPLNDVVRGLLARYRDPALR